MSSEKSLTPQIRFKGFTEAWEQRKFLDTFDFLSNNTLSRSQLSDTRGSTLNIHYGDVLIKFGELIDVSKESIPRIANDSIADILSCQKLKNGDVVIADTAEDITVGKCSELRKCENKDIVSGLHTIACRPHLKFASGYLGYYMNSNSFHNQLLPLMQGTKVISISKSAIKNTEINYPNLVEQRLIGKILIASDNLITLHQRKLDALKKIKSALLEKMFPKDGSSIPEIRFTGFTEAWEQRKLGEVFCESTDRSDTLEILSVSVSNGIYPAIESDRIINPGASITNYKVVYPNDVVFNSMRMWQGAVDVSRYKGIVSPAYVVARPLLEVDARLFSRLLKQPSMLSKYKQISQGNSKDTLTLKYDKFALISIIMPKSIKEQSLISRQFDMLDDLITLHQREHFQVK